MDRDGDRHDAEVLCFTVDGTNRGLWISFEGADGTRTRVHLSVAQARELARAMEETIAAAVSTLHTILSDHNQS